MLMKIRFHAKTKIRSNPLNINESALGVVYENTVMDVDDGLYEGAAIRNNSLWYRDANGWYYWSGGAERIGFVPIVDTQAGVQTTPVSPPVAPPTPPVAPVPKPPQPAIPIALPIPDDGLSPDIPEGETRLVVRKRGSDLESTGGSDGLESIKITPPFPIEMDNWKNPDPARINWGLNSHRIPSQWWQERKLTGKGVKIALLSTGAALQHPDLAGAVGATFYCDGNSVQDEHGIGTQAAIIAAGRGIVAFGVAPEATLLVGKIGQYDQNITPENLHAGIRWAIKEGAHIIAMLVDFRAIEEAVKQALEQTLAEGLDRNILLLAPVGNSAERRPESRYPAAFEAVLSVGAHDKFGQRCAFSAKSYHLDVLAPGEDLITSNLAQESIKNNKTTLIATAYTAGFLALLRQREMQKGDISTPNDLFEWYRSTAATHKSVTEGGNDVEYGFGLLNPVKLLDTLER